jgi:hypothetical protein
MRRRTMVPHCDVNAPIIDAFHCSECQWSYAMRSPKPYTIAYEDATRACWKFDDHHCEDFEPRGKMRAA